MVLYVQERNANSIHIRFLQHVHTCSITTACVETTSLMFLCCFQIVFTQLGLCGQVVMTRFTFYFPYFHYCSDSQCAASQDLFQDLQMNMLINNSYTFIIEERNQHHSVVWLLKWLEFCNKEGISLWGLYWFLHIQGRQKPLMNSFISIPVAAVEWTSLIVRY